MPRAELARPMTAGLVSALVGFTSSYVIVLAGLGAVGATPAQASSGLMAVCITMGAACILLTLTTRMPISVAWSTPGAALLVATGAVEGGWPVAVGAFLVTGALIVLTGLVRPLGALIARIPTPIAQAMLAGILFQLCLGPILGLAENPAAVAPVIVVWVIALRLLPRWASPLAFATAAIVIGIGVATGGGSIDASAFVPRIELTAPEFTLTGVFGIALPLYVVTMASQNVPGVAVMKSFDYDIPWRRSMVVTGVGTLVGAPAGGYAINLAAISAALAAGPDAGPDRSRRWIASLTVGILYIVFGIAAATFSALVQLSPAGVIAAVAGLALIGTFASAMHQALADAADRVPAVLTFAVAASGITLFGVSAAFWALIAGIVLRWVLRTGTRG